ncbi:hypothetical protein BDE27_2550 [Xenorhabdus ehlersii]|uniref:Uncharacterized protein n=1 Tax=Xenorhabdus ehlersii TaxID=290111 RepID=A0A2D0IJT8_9GAMM|nr:hypothetical protein [Xenorhabdus sp. TS4]PHM22022.1 hypothetical protein Xehl_04013 [Xenorhabdus ehlersii]RKE90667.1 hypothetical protein BDE27_2550 [Xenorhabdus ehlersii]
MWIKSLFNILIVMILFIFCNIGLISIDLTTKEVITLWTSNEYTPSELSFFINAADYVMLANNFFFILCTAMLLLRKRFKYSLKMIFFIFLIAILNNVFTFLYVLNFSNFFKFIKNNDIYFILISFPISMIIIYILARKNTYEQ